MSARRIHLAIAGWTILVAAAVTACGFSPTPPAATDSAPSASAPSTHPGSSKIEPQRPVTAAEAIRLLAGLPDARRVTPRALGYERSAFGTGWLDTDANGCNQRDDVLLRDATPSTARVRTQGHCDHDVIAGTWVDPYTTATLHFDDLKDPSQAEGVQIDHIVPLAEAWVSGASTWTFQRRRGFANELTELQAAAGPTNASKGDGDPAAWRPRKARQCVYAIRWVMIKSAWQLTVDPSERTALTDMLATCAG